MAAPGWLLLPASDFQENQAQRKSRKPFLISCPVCRSFAADYSVVQHIANINLQSKMEPTIFLKTASFRITFTSVNLMLFQIIYY